MINMQNDVIKTYRQHFPRDTFKAISKRTGIQATRVFRIFNGYKMKVDEYEKFKNAINSSEKLGQHARLFEFLSSNCIKTLSNRDLNELNHQMEKKIFLASLKPETQLPVYKEI